MVTSQFIRYRGGYKYQLANSVSILTNIRPPSDIQTEFIALSKSGVLFIRKGYAWDGPSGPTIDTKSSMRASLIHDALYQLMREGHLGGYYRGAADEELYRLCIEDGMWKWRAWLWRREVKKFAGFAACPSNNKEVLVAP